MVVWNRMAEDLFGHRADEVRGRSFSPSISRSPWAEIGPMLHRLTGTTDERPVTSSHAVVDRRGRSLRCTVTVGRLVEPRSSEPIGAERHVIVLVEPETGEPA